jgi:hypothetical protein
MALHILPLRELAQRHVDTFLLSVALGVWYSCLGWVVQLILISLVNDLPSSRWLPNLIDILPLTFFYGGLIGVFWSLFAVPILSQTPLRQASITLCLVVTCVSVSGSIIDAFRPQSYSAFLGGLLTIAPTCIFVITCLFVRYALPIAQRVCPVCATEMKKNNTNACNSCGDFSLFHRHAVYVRLLSFSGIGFTIFVAALFILTRNSSCGYWGYRFAVLINQGALVIKSDIVTYEGWVWTAFSFVPGDGIVVWPIILKEIVIIPLWILVVPVAIASVFLRQVGRSYPKGFCQSCGYNLTGRSSARCPECGDAVNRLGIGGLRLGKVKL